MILYYLRNIVQNVPKTLKNFQSKGRPDTFFSLVTTTVISRHSCKISRECFRFLKTWMNMPKIDPKILHNASQHRDTCCKILLSTLTVRVIQKTSVQNFTS